MIKISINKVTKVSFYFAALFFLASCKKEKTTTTSTSNNTLPTVYYNGTNLTGVWLLDSIKIENFPWINGGGNGITLFPKETMTINVHHLDNNKDLTTMDKNKGGSGLLGINNTNKITGYLATYQKEDECEQILDIPSSKTYMTKYNIKGNYGCQVRGYKFYEGNPDKIIVNTASDEQSIVEYYHRINK
jgi:hypothetical protein